ncbi:MAG: DUF3179 domain-containing protein [Chloroflexota bacterium]
MKSATHKTIFVLAFALFVTACAPAKTPHPLAASTPPPLLPDDEPPPFGAQLEFSTDFSIHNVPYNDILSGGPPKDGIPPLDSPQFVSVTEADSWLKAAEPVILIEVDGDARAYPIQILMWHEIANDTVGGLPLTITFCPLCNTAIAFKRTVNPSTLPLVTGQSGQVLDFGTTGRLRYSNLIMYDRQTETWWQQATGKAIVGELTGTQLEFYPAAMISWADFKTLHPDGSVLSRETGFSRDYGRNPYFGYDDINQAPFLFDGATPDQLPPMARVLTVDLNNEAAAYPYDILSEVKVINDSVGGEDVVVFWAKGTASALDTSSIPEGRDVGAAVAYSRLLNEQSLTFVLTDGKITDEQTNSEWNIFGQAIAGELKGKQLTPVVSINHFWFSWAAFKPETRIYQQ